jgi:hypothetical protein
MSSASRITKRAVAGGGIGGGGYGGGGGGGNGSYSSQPFEGYHSPAAPAAGTTAAASAAAAAAAQPRTWCLECYNPRSELLEYDYTYDETLSNRPPQPMPRIRERGEPYVDSYNDMPWSWSFGTHESVRVGGKGGVAVPYQCFVV